MHTQDGSPICDATGALFRAALRRLRNLVASDSDALRDARVSSLYVHVCVCMYVCMYVCMHVCMDRL
jgi:hypothetical protein